MKKFEELSKAEKKVVKEEFSKTSLGKYFVINDFVLIFTVLIWLIDFTKINLFVSIIFLIIYIVITEIEHYKRKALLKEYYEQKNKIGRN